MRNPVVERNEINKFETLSKVLCGSHTPKDILSTSNNVRLTFVSDDTNVAQGFKVEWSMSNTFIYTKNHHSLVVRISLM